MSKDQILIVQRAISGQIPESGFGEFVRELIFIRHRSAMPIDQIDWVIMTKRLAYHFPELLSNQEFKEVYMQVQ